MYGAFLRSDYYGSSAPPVGAENPVTSRDLHILVDETAEPVASSDVVDLGSGALVQGS